MRFFPWSRSRPAEEQRQQQRTAGTEAAGNDKQQPIPFPLLPGYRRDEDLEMLIEEVQQLPAIDHKVLNQLCHTGAEFDPTLPSDALAHVDRSYPQFMAEAREMLLADRLADLAKASHHFKNYMCLFGAVRVAQFCAHVHCYCNLQSHTGRSAISKEQAKHSIARTMQVISSEFLLARDVFLPLIPEALRDKARMVSPATATSGKQALPAPTARNTTASTPSVR